MRLDKHAIALFRRITKTRAPVTDLSSLDRTEGLPRLGYTRSYQEVALELTQCRYKAEEVVGFVQRLVSLAGRLYAFRQMDQLEAVSEYLSNLPMPHEYMMVGDYYRALCIRSKGSLEQAELEFKQIAMKGSPVCGIRAILQAGSIALDEGKYVEALELLIAARKASAANGIFDPLTTVVAERNICVIRSLDGDHQGALDRLEQMLPYVHVLGSSNPFLLFDHINSLAVELMEVGRLEEAARASHIALSSPFAYAYPEWHETRNDITTRARRRSRSIISIGTPLAELSELESSNSQAAEGNNGSLFPAHRSAGAALIATQQKYFCSLQARCTKVATQELCLNERVSKQMAAIGGRLHSDSLSSPNRNEATAAPTRSPIYRRDAVSTPVLTDSLSLAVTDELPSGLGRMSLYQEIALELTQRRCRAEEMVRFGQRLTSLAEHLYSFRQMDRLESVSEVLSKLPLPLEHTLAGGYYKALCLKRRGNPAQARLDFEHLATKGSLAVRARAILSAGANALDGGDFATALKLLIEARKASASLGWCDPITTLGAERNICIIRSLDGDHQGALDRLEQMLPYIQVLGSSNPFVLFEYLNSLAVELMEVGRLEEAARASHLALASPYAYAYPEWQETGNDIFTRTRRPSRSTVSIGTQLVDSSELESSNGQAADGLNPSLFHTQRSTGAALIDRQQSYFSPLRPGCSKIAAQELALNGRAGNVSRLHASSFSSRSRIEAVAPSDFYQCEAVSTLMKRLTCERARIAFANRLVSSIEHAYTFRRLDVVQRISDLLKEMALPPAYSSVAAYFEGICVRNSGRNLSRSIELYESVLAKGPLAFRSRALLSLGTIAVDLRDLQSARQLYFQAACSAGSTELLDLSILLQSQENLTVLKSIHGDHRGALSDYEDLYPLARRVGLWCPKYYYNYLNSLAVELGAAGRLEEAANASMLALASPFASVCPEWSETQQEIVLMRRGASRSRVPVAARRGTSLSTVESNGATARQSLPNAEYIVDRQHRLRPQTKFADVLTLPDRRSRSVESAVESPVPGDAFSGGARPKPERVTDRIIPWAVYWGRAAKVTHVTQAVVRGRIPNSRTNLRCCGVGARAPPLVWTPDPRLPGPPVRGPPTRARGYSAQLSDPWDNSDRGEGSCLPRTWQNPGAPHTPRIDKRPRGPPSLPANTSHFGQL